ncbi:MAG TPA: CU044_5270 family protein [Baekduia sp.]|nr:CU044_5270 family protein [Baekduia sp.]
MLQELRGELIRVANGTFAIDRHSPWRRRAVAALAAAAIIASILSVLPSDEHRSKLGPASASAAQVLNRAASIARGHAAAVPPSTAYYYVHSKTSALSGAEGSSRLVVRDRRSWVSLARPGVVQQRVAGTARASRFGVPALRQYSIGEQRFGQAAFITYAPDPAALYRRLRDAARGQGASAEAQVFSQLGDALRETPTTPRLRAVLFRTLALVPGIRVQRDVRVEGGRTGTVVSHTIRGTRGELVFDPKTTEILAERQVVVASGVLPHVPTGTVIQSTVYLGRATVSQLPAGVATSSAAASCRAQQFGKVIHARVVSATCSAGWAVTRLSLERRRTTWVLWRHGADGYRSVYAARGGRSCPAVITKRLPNGTAGSLC